LTVTSETGRPETIGRQYSSSHSFDQPVIHDGKDFVCLDLPDQGTYMAGGGIELTKILNATNTHASGAKGWYAYIRNGSNNYSSINMTDFAVGRSGYVVPFVAQKNPNLTEDMDSRNVGLVHVVKNFETQPINSKNRMNIYVDPALVDTRSKNGKADGNVPATGGYGTSNGGGYRHTGVAWLTDYKWSDNITATCPKLFKFNSNRYLILFEEWGLSRGSDGKFTARNTYKTTKGMIVDEYGNVLLPAKDLGRMPLRFRDSLFRVDKKAAWVFFDPASYQFRMCLISGKLGKQCFALGFSDQLDVSGIKVAKKPPTTKPLAKKQPVEVAKKNG
jgi:hypothetical protein